jgi:hypothetical protein
VFSIVFAALYAGKTTTIFILLIISKIVSKSIAKLMFYPANYSQ